MTSDANFVLLDGIEKIGTCTLWSRMDETQNGITTLLLILRIHWRLQNLYRDLSMGICLDHTLEGTENYHIRIVLGMVRSRDYQPVWKGEGRHSQI